MKLHQFINLNKKSPCSQLGYFAFIAAGFFLLAQMVSLFILMLFGLSDLQSLSMAQMVQDPTILQGLKWGQAISSLLIFVATGMVLSWLKTGNFWRFYGIQQVPKWGLLLASLALFIVSVPIIQWLNGINQNIVFPPALQHIEQGMQALEKEGEIVTKAFLQGNSVAHLFVNLLIVAAIPAFGEELLFRGGLQTLLVKCLNKPHLAIFMGAFLFSLLHFQFYGFLPRFILGLVLGYMYYYTNNLWYPVLFHFVNNGLQVFLVWAGIISLDSQADELLPNMPVWLVLPALALFVFSGWWFKQQASKVQTPVNDGNI